MKSLVFYLMFCFLYCCSQNMNKNVFYETIFQDEEIIQLNNIEKNFYSLIFDNYRKKDTLTSLQKFFECIEEQQLIGNNHHLYLSCIFESEFVSLYHNIKNLKIWGHIWTTSSYYDPKTNEIIGYNLVYNESEKYFKYLKFLHDKNPEKYPYYYAIVLAGGGVVPTTFYTGMNKYVISYFNEADYKLIGAIHYLSIIFNELSEKNLINLNN